MNQVESPKPCLLSFVFIHQPSHRLQVSLPLFPLDWNATVTDYGSDMSLPLRIQVKLNTDYSSSTESVASPWWIKRVSNSPVRNSARLHTFQQSQVKERRDVTQGLVYSLLHMVDLSIILKTIWHVNGTLTRVVVMQPNDHRLASPQSLRS